jgi:integrase/recombinase XerD
METYHQYLVEKRKMHAKTANTYQRLVRAFEEWLANQFLKPHDVGVKHLLDYIAYLQSQQQNEILQRNTLKALRQYYNYLIEREEINVNPASNLFLKPAIRTVAHAPVSIEALHHLYENWALNRANSLEHKVIIGLLVYQAMTTAEILDLKIGDLQLSEGKVTIPSRNRSNHRTLKLEGNQVVFIQQYQQYFKVILHQELTSQAYMFPRARVLDSDGRLRSNYFNDLTERIKNVLPMVINAPHIRQSVIAHWTKLHDIRVVQYMSGHKWISSTQRYDLVSLETLQAEIDLLHPLNDT